MAELPGVLFILGGYEENKIYKKQENIPYVPVFLDQLITTLPYNPVLMNDMLGRTSFPLVVINHDKFIMNLDMIERQHENKILYLHYGNQKHIDHLDNRIRNLDLSNALEPQREVNKAIGEMLLLGI